VGVIRSSRHEARPDFFYLARQGVSFRKDIS
jgi:hypothetical protein